MKLAMLLVLVAGCMGDNAAPAPDAHVDTCQPLLAEIVARPDLGSCSILWDNNAQLVSGGNHTPNTQSLAARMEIIDDIFDLNGRHGGVVLNAITGSCSFEPCMIGP